MLAERKNGYGTAPLIALHLDAPKIPCQDCAMIDVRPLSDDHPDLAHSPLLRAALLTLQYAQDHGTIGLTKTKAFKRVFVHWAASNRDRSTVIQALYDAFTTAKNRDAFFATQSGQDNADLLLRRIGLAGPAADVLNNLVGCIFRCGWLLRHLDLLIDKMNQKSSLNQILKSVQRVLKSDTRASNAQAALTSNFV
jgi:hypothetical protein